MTDIMQKTFGDTVKATLRTSKMQGFRMCIDEKNNVSIAERKTFGLVCPSGTRKMLDVVITPVMVKTF